MYENTLWLDHAITPDKTFTMTDNDDGSVTLEPYGTVVQQGTNMSAENFNNIELGITDHDLALQILVVYMRQMGWTIDELADSAADTSTLDAAVEELEEKIEAAVEELEQTDAGLLSKIQTNAADIADLIEEHTPVTGTLDMERTTYSYPFPSDTIGLAWSGSSITTTNYTIEFTIEEQDGCVGDIVIDSKTANGFYCHYTGSAKSATVSYKIRGGIIA